MRIHFLIHVPHEEPAMILDWVNHKGYSYSFTRLYEEPTFPELHDLDCLVIMGGSMGVYDEKKYPWLKEEKNYIQKCIEHNRKVLGICLGSQLIASALGTLVYKNIYKEIGWHEVWVLDGDNADTPFARLPGSFTTFHWHDDTFDLPKEARWMASSHATRHQAFVYKKHVLALQFHLEFDEKTLNKMVRLYPEDFDGSPWAQEPEKILENNHLVAENKKLLYLLLDDFIDS